MAMPAATTARAAAVTRHATAATIFVPKCVAVIAAATYCNAPGAATSRVNPS